MTASMKELQRDYPMLNFKHEERRGSVFVVKKNTMQVIIAKQKELRVLVVRENGEEMEIIEEEHYMEETEMKPLEVEKDGKPIIELSLNSMVGLTNLGKMKVKGMINEKAVVVLVDCGALHNIILEMLVTLLNLPMKETSHYGVIIGSETAVMGKGICSKVELSIGNWKIIDNFLPLELGGVDVILEMQ